MFRIIIVMRLPVARVLLNSRWKRYSEFSFAIYSKLIKEKHDSKVTSCVSSSESISTAQLFPNATVKTLLRKENQCEIVAKKK